MVKNVASPSSFPAIIDLIADESLDKLIIAGRFETYDGHVVNSIARIHENGEYDPTFVPGAGVGTDTLHIIYDLALLANQTVVAVGRFPTYNGITKNGIVGILTQTTSDTTSPTITDVTSSSPDAIYGTGQSIPIEVTFSEPVNVIGSPELTLSAGVDRIAAYTSGSGTQTLTFTYTVQSGDTSTDLSYVHTGSLSSNG